ncbi:MAG: hypothetical protein ACRC0L_07080 [Angustibacter sp.]
MYLGLILVDPVPNRITYSAGAALSSAVIILLWLPPSSRFYRIHREIRARR